MKKTITLIFYFSLLLLFSCQQDNRSNKFSYDKNIFFDDILEVKSTAKIDTLLFRKEMKRVLPPNKLQQVFGNILGSGYQVLYMGLIIRPDGNNSCVITPEAGSIIFKPPYRSQLFPEDNVNRYENITMVTQPNGDTLAVSPDQVYFLIAKNLANAFKTTSGKYKGIEVTTEKLFQIDFTSNTIGKVTVDWNIKEIPVNKFLPVLSNSSYDMQLDYISAFPAKLKDDYKLLRNKVNYPNEAIKRGVNGKVLVRLYFESQGNLIGYRLIKGLGYGCDEAVIMAVKNHNFRSFPSEMNSSVILPFNFSDPNNPQLDITPGELIEKHPDKYNNLYVEWESIIPVSKKLNTQYKIVILIDREVVAQSLHSVNFGKGAYWFRWKPKEPGVYNYTISIDPENVLNDIDRSNNIVRGKLVIK